MLKVFEVTDGKKNSDLAQKFSLCLNDYSRVFVMTDDDKDAGLGILSLKSRNIYITLNAASGDALEIDLLFRSLLNSCSFLNDFNVVVCESVSEYVGGESYLGKFGFVKTGDNYIVSSQNITFKCC